MDNKYSKREVGSRLPRMNTTSGGATATRASPQSSAIPRPHKVTANYNNNNNDLIHNKRLIVCRGGDTTTDYNTRRMDSFNGSDCSPNSDTNCPIKTMTTLSSLCKSQSLNEIQYQTSDYASKVNVLCNGCDSQKAFSFEQLDEEFAANLKSRSSNLTKDNMNSDLNLMEMSIDESSTASLGLLPNILSPISPFDTFNQNIPFVSIESDFRNESQMKVNKNIDHNMIIGVNDGDDDSETGIPSFPEEESDADTTLTNTCEGSLPSVIAADNQLSDLNGTSDHTMEGICCDDQQEVTQTLEAFNSDNSMTLKSNTDNESMSIESIGDNLSDTNIPLTNEMVLKHNTNNDLNKASIRGMSLTTDYSHSSSKTIVKSSLNESKTNESIKSKNMPMKSCAVRPNSLATKELTKPAVMSEKTQRAASPSAKAPQRKKFKTPGRWDAVMTKIEKSKTSNSNNSIHNSVIKGKINVNVSRSAATNGSLHRISPSDELSIADDNNSSHLSPSSASIKSVTNSLTTKKIAINSNTTSKVNIPKSKTFVRDPNDCNANNGSHSTTGRQQSQQPLSHHQQHSNRSIATTPVTPHQPPVDNKSASQTIRRDRGAVGALNEKKLPTNRRPTQPNTTGPTVTAAKRMTNTKISASNASAAKRDVRSAQTLDDRQQIQTLTQLCDTKTKQLKTLGLDQSYMRLAFDSLSVTIQHLIEQYEPFETPKIKQALKTANARCEQLRDNINAKDVELNDMKIIFEEQINQLMKEREKNYSDLNEAKVTHELNIKKLKEMHLMDVKKLEHKYTNELKISEQNCTELVNQMEEKTTELNQTKQTKETLESRLNQMEKNIMNDKDKRFKYLSEKSKQLELEVESLKVVMEMKNEKIHSSERKLIEMQEKINELPFAKENIRSLQQQVETLQVTLDRKIHQYNQLTREHHDLQCLYEKEMREKRRLSMKNEELAFHLSESFSESATPGPNNCSHLDTNHMRFKSPAINLDETPIKTNHTISVNNSYSSNRKSHSKVNRSKSISSTTTTTTTSLATDRRDTQMTNCSTPAATVTQNNENHFLLNSTLDEVFDGVTNLTDSCNSMPKSIKKGFHINTYDSKYNIISVSSHETPPQCILDSGFEEIQGLNSLTK